jgi:hypothetical protein
MKAFTPYVFIDGCNAKHYEVIDTSGNVMSQFSDFVDLHQAIAAGPVSCEETLTNIASLRNEKG